jgi:hypothetical protein
MTDLPDAALFAAEVANLVSGRVKLLEEGEWKAYGVQVDDSCSLLLRDNHETLSLSLATDAGWQLSTRADCDTALEELPNKLAAYQAAQPEAVTMADVALKLAPLLWHLAATRSVLSFPGTPIPSEAWLRAGHCAVGLFQDESAARVVVSVRDEARSFTIARPSELSGVPGLVRASLLAQIEAAAETSPAKA